MGMGFGNFLFLTFFLGEGVVKKKQEIWIWGGSTSVRSQKGGVHMVAVKNGGGVLGCKQNWGGVGIWWPKAADFVHPPPQDDFDSFPN